MCESVKRLKQQIVVDLNIKYQNKWVGVWTVLHSIPSIEGIQALKELEQENQIRQRSRTLENGARLTYYRYNPLLTTQTK